MGVLLALIGAVLARAAARPAAAGLAATCGVMPARLIVPGAALILDRTRPHGRRIVVRGRRLSTAGLSALGGAAT